MLRTSWQPIAGGKLWELGGVTFFCGIFRRFVVGNGKNSAIRSLVTSGLVMELSDFVGADFKPNPSCTYCPHLSTNVELSLKR